MIYLGNKRRIAQQLLAIILAERTPDQTYVEPFVGGGDMFSQVQGERLGADIHAPCIQALRAIRDDAQKFPDVVTETDYEEAMRKAKARIPLKGYEAWSLFALSFGGKFMGGYRRDKAGTRGCMQNMQTQSRRAKARAVEQSKLLQGAKLVCSGYATLAIPPDSIIYCDPPYKGVTGYTGVFDHEAFWEWVQRMASAGHSVFVSEYSAPEGWEAVWEKPLANGVAREGKDRRVALEKLFVWHGERQVRSTKTCPQCGNSHLGLVRTQGRKWCPDCGTWIQWELEEGQKTLA